MVTKQMYKKKHYMLRRGKQIMKKRIFALFMAGVLSASMLAGCGNTEGTTSTDGADASASDTSEATTGGTYRIGYSMPMRDQFQTSMEKAMSEKAAALGIDLPISDADGDVTKQISHVQTWEADGFDAVIVGLVNNDSAEDVLAAAGDMKVVFVNRQPNLDVLKDGEVVYVGTDETLYGTAQASYLATYFEQEGKTDVNIAMFMGVLGLDNVTKRTDSAKKGLEAAGINATYVFENTAEWERMKAMNLYTQFMGSGTQVDAVICNNDEMALGVIEAMLTSSDGEVTCPVVGIDATDVGCAAIKEGTLAASVFQDPVAQGEGALFSAIGLLEGKEVEGLVDNYYNIEPQLVTIDNVDEFM